MHRRLVEKQATVLSQWVRGKVVHDLGAGDLSLAYELIRLGAERVVAIDQRGMYSTHPHVITWQGRFRDYHAPASTAFLSFPINDRLPGLLDILKTSEHILYLGKNTDGTSCGNQALFMYFLQRKILDYIPSRQATLIVYGSVQPQPREPKGEELAALDTQKLRFFTDLEPECVEPSGEMSWNSTASVSEK